MRRLLAIVAVALACAYAGVLGLLYVKQRDLLYPRNPARAETAAANLPGVEEVRLTTADGVGDLHLGDAALGHQALDSPRNDLRRVRQRPLVFLLHHAL